MRAFHIQYASNLFVHQNSSWKHAQRLLIPRKAPFLALLGNIGNPRSQKTKDFVRWCTDTWDTVYCVPGPSELRSEERLNGLFPNLPKNLHLMDQIEERPDNSLVILGCPVWTGHASEISKIPNWSEEEQFFLAYRSPNSIGFWHEEDKEYLLDRIRSYQASHGSSVKILLLTHSVPHQTFLSTSSKPPEKYRKILLHDGNFRDLFQKNVIGCLSGAGGESTTGFLGPFQAFCGINPAFTGPSMVPNPQYRPDMTASFPLYQWPISPDPSSSNNYERSFPYFLPRPQLAITYAHSNLQ